MRQIESNSVATRRLFAACLSVLLLLSPTGATTAFAEKDPLPDPADAENFRTPGLSRLAGEIRTREGEEAVSAEVRLVSLEDGETRNRTKTGDHGRYELDGVVHGYYQVVVEYGGEFFLGNRILSIPPKEKIDGNFDLGPFLVSDMEFGLAPGMAVPGEAVNAAGIARLEERLGPSGLAWFSTPTGVTVLLGGGAAAVALLIAANDDGSAADDAVQSPASP